jgi:hypothetical protein
MSKHATPAGDIAGLLMRFAQLQEKAQARTGQVFPIIVNRAGFAGGCLVWLLRGHRDGLKLRVVACFGFGRWHVADGLE